MLIINKQGKERNEEEKNKKKRKKDDDNVFECLKINSEFKICWDLVCLTTLDAMLRCLSIQCYSNIFILSR